ncbi:hypothetical protein Pan241w_24330 [Gimesia alba]|uniref:Uncharacterized protein n=2 Tax=Gimesia alba TaxID=2527973 RepID=A0A517RES6_9PLAN|nr:hypothetical protein Pan241w_24330 [Gimesia alba]
MVRFRFAFILILGLLFIVGCGRSTSPPKASEPMNPEEAALDIVTAIYTISARVNEAGPQNWESLEAYAKTLQSPAQKDALDAIQKIKSLDYQVTWGINMKTIKDQGANASEFVILESPDGQLKSTFGGVIIKADPAVNSEEVKPEEPVFEPNRKKTKETETTTE